MQNLETLEHKFLVPFLLVTSLFFMWGMANSMNDTLIAAFKHIMSMSDAQTSLIQCAFYGSYFCFALPAALFIRRHSYKAGIILGLSLYATGTMLFYPASLVANYGFFLLALYVLASGCSILETTANPFILSMGAPETATRRLNIAQSFNPLGCITGILVAQYYFLNRLENFTAITNTYMGIGFVMLLILGVIIIYKMPDTKGEEGANRSTVQMSTGEAFRILIRRKYYRMGVVAEFAYVGAQTGVWSFTIRLVMEEFGCYEKEAAFIFLISMICFSCARFFFTWLMKYIAPIRLLMVAGVLDTILGLIIVFGAGGGWITVGALILTSFFMSLMFPTIYGTSLDGLREESTLGASGLVMAILGGAVLTPLQGLLSDATSVYTSYLVPTVCFMMVTLYGIYALMINKK